MPLRELSPAEKLERLLALADGAMREDDGQVMELLDEAAAYAELVNVDLPLLECRQWNAELARQFLKQREYDLAMDAFDRARIAANKLVREAATPVQKRYRQDDNEKLDIEFVEAAFLAGRSSRDIFIYVESAKGRWLQGALSLIPYDAPRSIPEGLRMEELRLLDAVHAIEATLSNECDETTQICCHVATNKISKL